MEQHPTCAPPPAPVPVAGAVVPVDFKVVKKGPEMAMHDAIGRLAFRAAAGTAGPRRSTMTLEVSWSPSGAAASRKEVHVFISPRSTVEDSKPSYRLIGSTYRRACTIIKGDSIVAQTNLLYKLKKTIYSRRKFRVTIYPANDNILVMAMIVTFFVKK
ncbi:hypothetical protein BDA96_09G103700 [Sorghum bicolor]|uniref:Uncharacterized protein n=1 Tax=Sorghum bicolor TaxID=4558 RepID=A0A921U456_SORBI|nr:hypothetical protein BDA96_09G103700 [Sorghum bicolor]